MIKVNVRSADFHVFSSAMKKYLSLCNLCLVQYIALGSKKNTFYQASLAYLFIVNLIKEMLCISDVAILTFKMHNKVYVKKAIKTS